MQDPIAYSKRVFIAYDGQPKAKVCIIYTGGTIGMVPKYPDNPAARELRPGSIEDLLGAVGRGGLGQKVGIQAALVTFEKLIDSTYVTPRHWAAIAQAIYDNYDEFDGFVVLHGTDTMAYTASALSFMLENLRKPVVVTGSQLPMLDPCSDARQNLEHAIRLAGHRAIDLPAIPEVVILFRDHILRGDRAVKVGSDIFEGFGSPNFDPLGELGEHMRVTLELALDPPPQDEKKFPFRVNSKLAKGEIKVIWIHPMYTSEQLIHDLATPNLIGVVICTYGAGNMPTSPKFLEPIRQAIYGGAIDGVVNFKNAIPVLNISQCPRGLVEMGLYEASGGLLEIGVANGVDLTLEAAMTKMLWALMRSTNVETIKNLLQTSIRGEQSQSVLDMSFVPEIGYDKAEESSIVRTAEGRVPGRYSSENLRRAVLRVQGLGFESSDKGRNSLLRVFINDPRADEDTASSEMSYVCEEPLVEQKEEGFAIDVTGTVSQVVNSTDPVIVTLVGINAVVWCRSIHLSLYIEPIH